MVSKCRHRIPKAEEQGTAQMSWPESAQEIALDKEEVRSGEIGCELTEVLKKQGRRQVNGITVILKAGAATGSGGCKCRIYSV